MPEIESLTVNQETILFSFPKCGRTWLRYLFLNLYGEVLAAEHEPNLGIEDQRKIILIRDPRDVMVSYFFEVTKRAGFSPADAELTKPWESSGKEFSDLIRIGTVDQFFLFYERCREIAEPKLIVRYEDLQADTLVQLARIDSFLEGSSLSQICTLEDAVQASSFESMRKLESGGEGLRGEYHQGTWLPNLTPRNPSDFDSYKTRVGKVGEFSKYFSEEDMHYFLGVITQKYSEVLLHYGYPYILPK